MPAPVRRTVWELRPTSWPLRSGDDSAEKKAATASIAPDMVLADGGVVIGGGSGPVKGILIELLVMREAWPVCSCMSCDKNNVRDAETVGRSMAVD